MSPVNDDLSAIPSHLEAMLPTDGATVAVEYGRLEDGEAFLIFAVLGDTGVARTLCALLEQGLISHDTASAVCQDLGFINEN